MFEVILKITANFSSPPYKDVSATMPTLAGMIACTSKILAARLGEINRDRIPIHKSGRIRVRDMRENRIGRTGKSFHLM